MTYSNTHDEKRSPTEQPQSDTADSAESGLLPPEPNPNHPRHDREGARRTFKRLKAGPWTSDHLSTYEYGLIAYWYPWLVPDGTEGGE